MQFLTRIDPLVRHGIQELQQGATPLHVMREIALMGALVGAGMTPAQAIQQVEQQEATLIGREPAELAEYGAVPGAAPWGAVPTGTMPWGAVPTGATQWGTVPGVVSPWMAPSPGMWQAPSPGMWQAPMPTWGARGAAPYTGVPGSFMTRC